MIRPRQLVHRGTVQVTALLLERAITGDEVARSRAIALWERGVLIQDTPQGYLVRLPSPRMLDASTAPGAPLVELRFRGLCFLSAAPLDTREVEALSPKAGSVYVPRSGTLRELEVGGAVDPSSWIELDAWTEVEVRSLGAPPQPARAATAPTADVERVLRRSAALSNAESEAVARAIRQAGSTPSDPAGITTMGRSGSLAGLAVRMNALLAQALERSKDRGSSRWARALSAISSWLSTMILRSRLSTIFAERQARYLSRLFEMFDQGDLDAALRHAIPLGGGGSPAAPALDVPKPRSELTLSYTSTTATSSLGLGVSVYDQLRQRYRAAFKRLEEQGRVEEAAFVLAELLESPEEAVAYLERHGHLRLAAALAEGRQLAPGLVVRQWFLAGNRKRAIAIAIARGGFADAVARLERAQKQEEAVALRMAWAERLAATGDYAGAVDVARAVEDARTMAAQWLDAAIDAGGPSGARMLALKLIDETRDRADCTARALSLLEATGAEGRRDRLAFARMLAARRHEKVEHVAPIARATLRALYGDADAGDSRTLQRVADEILDLTADAGLRADRPRWAPSRDRQARFRHHVVASDRGLQNIRDAALLPRGRTLVALGEAGVACLSRTGRRTAHFDQPATSLVISDHGDRAIAVVRRGDFHRLARIDVIGGRSEVWCEAEIDGHAPTFDGSTWVVATAARGLSESSDLLLVDVLESDFAALRRYPGVGDGAATIARSATRCEVLAGELFGPLFALSFELPSWTLRARAELRSPSSDGARIWSASPDGVYAAFVADHPPGDPGASPPDGRSLTITLRGECRSIDGLKIGAEGDETLRAIQIDGPWIAVLSASARGQRAVVVDRNTEAVVGEVLLDGSTSSGLRLANGHLVVFDDLGRLLSVDIEDGALVRDLRI